MRRNRINGLEILLTEEKNKYPEMQCWESKEKFTCPRGHIKYGIVCLLLKQQCSKNRIKYMWRYDNLDNLHSRGSYGIRLGIFL